jgi:hypothetical protein
MTEELIQKFQCGNNVTDKELKQLYCFFAEIEEGLSLMGKLMPTLTVQ